MKEQLLPQPGDRVGSVCGPCEFPKDNAGTVITTYGNQFYNNIALVLLDKGGTATIVGEYTKVGIGWYLIQPAKVAA